MNFNNVWKSYINSPKKSRFKLLSEQKRKNFLLILESRKKEAKKRYPITDQFEVIDVIAIQLRSQFGDKGVSRYIMFASKCMEEFYQTHTTQEGGVYRLKSGIRATAFYEQVMGLVMEFHRVSQRLKEKDINKYTFDSLYQTLDELPESPGERKRRLKDKSTAYKDSEIIYNDMGIFAVRPLTTQASCYFGENPRLTTWCISTKSKRNYFKEFTQQDGKAFVMAKFSGIPEGNPMHFITLEFDRLGELVSFHNAPNKEFDPDELEDVIADHLEGMLELNPGFERVQFEPLELLDAIKKNSKEWILANPPPDPFEAAESRCVEAGRIAEQEYEFVSPSWHLIRNPRDDLDPSETPKVVFYADLEVVWDVDKPEYEAPNGDNSILKRNYRFWRDFETKFSDNLIKFGRPWSDMAGQINCYTEDGYVKLRVRFDGYDSYHPETAAGFESFTVEDCRAMENRGVQMQELLGKMLEQEVESYRELNSEESQDPEIQENKFYKELEKSLIGEERGRSRQRGIYKFYCMISYILTSEGEKSRGLDDILADMRALENVTIVTVAIRNQKIGEGRYIAGLAIKFIPSTPGDINTPENVKARIVRDIKRLGNVQSLFKLSTGLIRLE